MHHDQTYKTYIDIGNGQMFELDITLTLLLQIFFLLTDMVTASYCTPAMQDLHKDALEAGITIVNEVSIYCCVPGNFRKSLTLEATPSATQFFKRSYKTSHPFCQNDFLVSSI